MAKRTYQLYCEYCNWKKITDGTDVDLYEISRSPIPGGVPKKDSVTNETIAPKIVNQPKLLRCPRCGMSVTPKKILNPQEKLDEKALLDQKIRERIENENKEAELQRIRYENWFNGNQDGFV